jgi:hypothetical protein
MHKRGNLLKTKGKIIVRERKFIEDKRKNYCTRKDYHDSESTIA